MVLIFIIYHGLLNVEHGIQGLPQILDVILEIFHVHEFQLTLLPITLVDLLVVDVGVLDYIFIDLTLIFGVDLLLTNAVVVVERI